MDRYQLICSVAGVSDIGEVDDGYHTFNSLYYQRLVLFATIVTERVNKYVNRNDMDLEKLKEDLSEIKDDKIPE